MLLSGRARRLEMMRDMMRPISMDSIVTMMSISARMLIVVLTGVSGE